MSKTKNAKRDVEIFKAWFKLKYGVAPKIIYAFPTKKPRYSLQELKDIINDIIKKNPYEYDAEVASIDMVTREAAIVLYRQIYFYIANDWGYKLTEIARGLGNKKNHATVIHGLKKLNDQIELGDKLTINKLNLVINAIEEKLGAYGDVPQNHNKEFNPESVLSPMLLERKYGISTDQFASRHEGSNNDWIC
jgi:hypothetical protein